MGRPKTNTSKKLVSISEGTTAIMEEIKKVSYFVGLSESRIIEDCIIYGYALLYGKEENVADITNIMKKRYGNMIDEKYIKNIICIKDEKRRLG